MFKTMLGFLALMLCSAVFCRNDDSGLGDVNDDYPKASVYAFFGAISQNDWDFIAKNSTPGFKDRTNFSLFLQAEMGDVKLSQLVEKHFAIDRNRLISLEGFSEEEFIKVVSGSVRDRDSFFLAGLRATSSTPGFALRVPKGIKEVQFKKDSGIVKAEYNLSGEEEALHSSLLYFKKVNNTWMLASKTDLK